METFKALFKELPFKVASASASERIAVCKELQLALESGQLPEAAVRVAARQLVSTLSRHADGGSRRAAFAAIASCLSAGGRRHVMAALAELARSCCPAGATKSMAVQWRHCLACSCLLLQQCFLGSDVDDSGGGTDSVAGDFSTLACVQARWLSGVVAAQHQHTVAKTLTVFDQAFSVDAHFERYLAHALRSDSTLEDMVLAAAITAFLDERNQLEARDKMQSAVFGGLLRVALTCSRALPPAALSSSAHSSASSSAPAPPPLALLSFCSGRALRRLQHGPCGDQLIPAVSRALLRSPELLTARVHQLLEQLSLDLSQYVQQLSGPLISQVYSGDESTRAAAVRVVAALGAHCSDGDAVAMLVGRLLDVLAAGDGHSRLTQPQLRQSVLLAVGALSDSALVGSSLQSLLAETIMPRLCATVDAESHEPTAVLALRQLRRWCARITATVPDQLCQWLQSSLRRTSAASSFRLGCLLCMDTLFRGSTVHQLRPLLPTLLTMLDKMAANSSQLSVLSEGVVVCVLALRLTEVDPDTNLDQVFAAILDSRQYFFNERFLQSLSSEVCPCVCQLCEQLMLVHWQRVEPATEQVARTLAALLLTHPANDASPSVTVRRLMRSLDAVQLAERLLHALSHQLSVVRVVSCSAAAAAAAGTAGGCDASTCSASAVQSALDVVMTVRVTDTTGDHSEADMLASALLLPAHHPALVEEYPRLWLRLVKRLPLDPHEFVSRNASQMIGTFTKISPFTESHRAALTTLCRCAGDLMTSSLLQHVIDQLTGDADMLAVTVEQYQVYQTPAGVLYDTSVKESAREQQPTGNIKRDSKAYSYREQMEELALRRELAEERRRRQQLHEQPEQLSDKQRQAVAAQLDKESGIRQQVAQAVCSVQHSMCVLRALISGDQLRVLQHYRHLVPAVLGSLASAAAAPLTAPLFVQLTRLVVDLHANKQSHPSALADCLGHVTLRLLAPACHVSDEWLAEQPPLAVYRRLVRQIGQYCATNTTAHAGGHGLLTAPAFSVCLPLLRHVLSACTGEPDTMVLALQFITAHVQLRGDGGLTDPSLLPLHDIFQLLINVIGTSSGGVQQAAHSALLATAAACCGQPHCARVSDRQVIDLLHALHSSVVVVRDIVLRSLSIMSDVVRCMDTPHVTSLLTARLLLARFDVNADVRDEAKALWRRVELHTRSYDSCGSAEEIVSLIVCDVTHTEHNVQQATADTLAYLVQRQQQQDTGAEELDNVPSLDPETLLQQLIQLYNDKLQMTEPELDQFGRVLSEPLDLWQCRVGVALTLRAVGPHCTQQNVVKLMSFFVPLSLGDRSAEVRKQMLAAALACVEAHGKSAVSELLPVFETFLDDTPEVQQYDCVRQAVVVLMGTLAKHLERADIKVKPIFMRLLKALDTPSEQVQCSVAACLPSLVPAVRDDTAALMPRLLDKLLQSERFCERRGAAYGIAGLVKGCGIMALKQLDVMNTLIAGVQHKKDYRQREGALFAFTMLCTTLGRLFEPYVVHVLPHLLLCYGDSSSYVRDATDETARAVMSSLSTHGVKLVLPALLAALQEDSWRTKAGSVELLGSMAFCAPKQLSSCLPSVVPQLIEVLGDSHQRVQKAASQALQQIGSVIRNPEIQAIVPTLMAALRDPANKTSTALTVLIDTQFVHFIDAPSLALIMPVVQRAFQDRSTEVRKMAAQIIGNMYSLTDQKDLSPYLPAIIPGLKSSLLDPVPEVRGKSARALGAMVRGIGESSFDDLLPWLMQTMTSDSGAVDRSGAAQGLSEVVGALGVQKLHKIMPDVVQTAARSDIAAHVKDGYIMLFIYMPVVFPEEFTRYIGDIIPAILKALADETEFVRETALRAGQRIVNTYADTAVQLLLPQLETGLFDDNWRIRLCSVQLLGDLLYRISGVSGKMTTETAGDDDNFGTEHSQKAITRVLGAERRNRVLAGLYMGRSDVALLVRQNSLHVWKVVVANTPRTLRDILPTLFSLLLGHLASDSHDKRQVAARTLGDLVRKLGERVLPEIIPILEAGLNSAEPEHRQGVCVGLSEIISSTSRDMILLYTDSLVPTVRRALCDPLPEVRVAAARTFDSLHSVIGARALDDILPPLMQQLADQPDHVECAHVLDGLRQVMAVKARVVLPCLVPQLVAPPVNTRALSVLATVAGESLTRHLGRILPALLTAAASHDDCSSTNTNGGGGGGGRVDEKRTHCESVLLAVQDAAGVRVVIDELTAAAAPAVAKNKAPAGGRQSANEAGGDDESAVRRRRLAVGLLAVFCSETRVDYSDHNTQLVRAFVQLFAVDDEPLLLSAWDGLAAVIKRLPLDTGDTQHLADLRQAFRFATADLSADQLLPGLCLTKGIAPLLPVYREAMLNGAAEQKEAAAVGISELVRVASSAGLRSSVVHITGPLIRVLGDRFVWTVKVAVLECLTLLLAKVGAMLRPFLPQLQTTFLKAVCDAQRAVRVRAAAALGRLMAIHVRVEPLLSELLTLLRAGADDASGIRDTTLQALRCVCGGGGGGRLPATCLDQLLDGVLPLLSHADESTRLAAAGCAGQLVPLLAPEQLQNLLSSHVLNDDMLQADWIVLHGRSAALYVSLKCAPAILLGDAWRVKTERVVIKYMQSDRVPVVMNGVRAAAYLLAYQLHGVPQPAGTGGGVSAEDAEQRGDAGRGADNFSSCVLQPLVRAINHSSNEVKVLSVRAVELMATTDTAGSDNDEDRARESTATLPATATRLVLPMLVNGTKEKNSAVRAASETALCVLLQLNSSQQHTQQRMVGVLESGARDALVDVIGKLMRKNTAGIASPRATIFEQLDETTVS